MGTDRGDNLKDKSPAQKSLLQYLAAELQSSTFWYVQRLLNFIFKRQVQDLSTEPVLLPI